MRSTVLLSVLALVATTAAAPAGGGEAPGAPGDPAVYQPADKQGLGTAHGGPESPVWFTLGGGRMTEVFYPDLSTPATRELALLVTDGRSFTEEFRGRTEQVGDLTYRQSARGTGWSATATYVTDPKRATVLVDVSFTSTRPLKVFALYDPALSREGNDDTGASGDTLVASDAGAATALVAGDGFRATSTGYLGKSDGRTDLADHRMDWRYPKAGPGNVVQTGELTLDGVRHKKDTLALGFGTTRSEAVRTARASLSTGFRSTSALYAKGWQEYVSGLRKPPSSVASAKERAVYRSSLLVLAASEDKRHRGAYIAAPGFPWAFGFDRQIAPEFGSYALVWPRDLYQIATGLLAAGDKAGANRALDFMLTVQQQPDGHLAQNTRVTGEPYWTSVQLDESAAPMLLAWQLKRTDRSTLDGLRRAADFMVSYPNAPFTEQERWENQSGYSPGTIAAEIAGLVCLADLLNRAGDPASANRYLRVADDWESKVESWTATSTGPLSPSPYYLRLTKDGNPNAGTTYNLGDNNVGEVDQRAVVDPSFLELVRLGIRPANDPVVENTVEVVDETLGERTPVGQLWHRFTGDGYGEQADGGPWNVNWPTPTRTYGRLWPIFAGERGEYELLAGEPSAANSRLRTIAATANSGLMLPEQVWDERAPQRAGTPTTSATPLAWTHAQYVRLAWSLTAGHPVEQPSVVACRYVDAC
ncbi:glycoside hydrolase family 15 protein [Actinophytocola oryzae]|uniref:Glucoamylase n=1 Tax=Actinophytocola oryzae TaxID=502181 RepID=A0A4R7V727_9PSEU|nr:glycoside hydrolase family 15 protein [Actinophytocola oryzae]TDV44840.1 glucoamylase [Actinophytocola oryzae]